MKCSADFGAEDAARLGALQRRQSKRCLQYAALGVFSIVGFSFILTYNYIICSLCLQEGYYWDIMKFLGYYEICKPAILQIGNFLAICIFIMYNVYGYL